MEMERTPERDEERAPEIAELGLEHRPDGPAAAAMLAAGIGVLTLGILTLLTEVSTGIHDWLEKWEFGRGVGPLAGKTTLAVIVWLVSWAILGLAFRGKEVSLKGWIWATLVLVVLGFLLTFPPIFTAFATE